jgi:hypothetical protein
MSEEQGGNSIKNILIGLVSTVTIGVGTFVTNKLTGGEEEAKTEVSAPAPAPVINITNTNQQKQEQAAPAGKTIIIKEKAAPVKAQEPAQEKKKKEEEETW